MNELKHVGIVTDKHTFSEKVGSVKIQIEEEYKGKKTLESFYWTAFGDTLKKVSEVPVGTKVSFWGKVKNNSYEKNGVKVWKQENILLKFNVLDTPKPMPDVAW